MKAVEGCMHRVFVVGLLALVGCAERASVGREVAAPQQVVELAEARRAFVSEYVVPSCSADAPRGAPCGLVVDEMTTDAFLKAFTAQCEATSLGTSECAGRFLQELDARLAARYPRAKEADIAARCAAPGALCQEITGRELAWLGAHDESVIALAHAAGEMVPERWHRNVPHRSVGVEASGRLWTVVAAALRGEDVEAVASAGTEEAAPVPYDGPFHAMALTGCHSDLDCSVGQECVMGTRGLRGVCILPVDERGLSTVAASPVPNCMADNDCNPGFRCSQRGNGGGRCVR
jgi:hypothetical protein